MCPTLLLSVDVKAGTQITYIVCTLVLSHLNSCFLNLLINTNLQSVRCCMQNKEKQSPESAMSNCCTSHPGYRFQGFLRALWFAFVLPQEHFIVLILLISCCGCSRSQYNISLLHSKVKCGMNPYSLSPIIYVVCV